ncbi:hypothetical protein ABEY41_01120 [Peribacillus butanolivorans]
MDKVKVLIVDDSVYLRKFDTLDVEMQVMNGREVNRIMDECPTAEIMFSSTMKEGMENTFASMYSRAFDFVAKTLGAISLDLYKIKKERV